MESGYYSYHSTGPCMTPSSAFGMVKYSITSK